MENHSRPSQPIGIFDSGFGGLTVFKSICELMPSEDIIYLGDAARLPYGSKSPETVERYARECALWLIGRGVKLIVIACHTASSIAAVSLQEQLCIPVIGMVDPSLSYLMDKTPQGPIAILGTQATISSGIYQKRLNKKCIIPVACPLFAPLIEEGLYGTHISQALIEHYLAETKILQPKAALLACTHYPLIKNEIANYLGSQCLVVDPALPLAQATQQTLQAKNLLSAKQNRGSYRFFTSDDPNKFTCFGETFLHQKIENVEKVYL